jgi:2-C-methyl-D-erythritol 4-phosphate cytidylyltransferase
MIDMPKFYAVVPAAGVGRRMASLAENMRPKQYLSIAGKTIFEHTLEKLLLEPRLERLVVAINPEDDFAQSLSILKHERIELVNGGQERSDSVLNGIDYLASKAGGNDWVLVHDVARPCVTSALIKQLIGELENHPVGGILAVPSSDTLKQVSDKSIGSTIDRMLIWQAQTPQMFRLGLLRSALTDALAKGLAVTDESSAMELAGHSPLIVKGLKSNLKITQPEDLALAEYYLQQEQQA